MKKGRKRRGKVLIILLIVLAVTAGGLGYAYVKQEQNRTKPRELFNQYIDALKAGKYDTMYALLSTESKQSIDKESFITRNQKIYEGIGMSELNVTIAPETEEKSETVSYQMSFQTSAGEVSFDNEAEYVKEDGEYALQWKDALILPNLTATDKIKVVTSKAARGMIVDRNGIELATEGKASSVGLIPGKMKEDHEKDIQQIAKLLGVSEESIQKKLSANWVKDDSFVPIKTIAKVDEGNLMLTKPDKENVANSKLQDQLLQISGILITDVSVRSYPYKEITSHLVGYVQNVTAEDLQEHEGEGYATDSQIGRSGMEALYEKELKGTDGIEIRMVDEAGNKKEVIASKPKEDGKQIQLTIDVALQTTLYNTYKKDKSCSVAMNQYTGEILALVSTPSYDANDFILGMSEDEWNELNNDKAQPMYNRFRQKLCPGSSFKPVIAAIGLETKAIDPNKDYKSEGTSWQKDKSWGSYYVTTLHTYTPVTMKNALIYSDNIYFAKAALSIGKENLMKSLTDIGFTKQMPFEINLAASQYSNDKEITGEVQLADSGYGQGQVLVNPIHMASIYSAFVNDGNMIQPYLLYKEEPKAEYFIKGAFSKENAKLVEEGLEAVVNNPHGTAYEAHRKDVTLAGKTGTAEIKQSKEDTNGTELGWFNVMTTDSSAKNPILLISMVEDVKGRGGSGYVVNKSTEVLKDYLK